MGDNYYLLPTVLVEWRDWRTIHMTPVLVAMSDDVMWTVSHTSSNSIIFSLCFLYAFIMLSLCFHYAFIMLSLCLFRYEINKGFFFRRCHLFTYYFPNTRIPLSSCGQSGPCQNHTTTSRASYHTNHHLGASSTARLYSCKLNPY